MQRAEGLGLDYGHLEKAKAFHRQMFTDMASAIVASGIAGSDHRDWQPQALAMATTDTSQSIIQSVSDTTSTGSSCTPLSHSVQQCLSCQVVPQC